MPTYSLPSSEFVIVYIGLPHEPACLSPEKRTCCEKGLGLVRVQVWVQVGLFACQTSFLLVLNCGKKKKRTNCSYLILGRIRGLKKKKCDSHKREKVQGKGKKIIKRELLPIFSFPQTATTRRFCFS